MYIEKGLDDKERIINRAGDQIGTDQEHIGGVDVYGAIQAVDVDSQ